MTITATTDAALEASQPTPTTSTQETVQAPRTGRPARRAFTAEYKRRIVAEYEQAPSGQKGRVLRREGLYDSSVKQWRAQIEAGTLGSVRLELADLFFQLGKLESDAARKDKVIADRDAALEVMGKGVAFLEALSRKNKE